MIGVMGYQSDGDEFLAITLVFPYSITPALLLYFSGSYER